MRVSEAVQKMTKIYLQRIIDSFAKDFPRTEEEKAREIILRNVEELSDTQRIVNVLKFDGLLSDRILVSCIVESMVNRSDYTATEEEILIDVVNKEEHILQLADESDSLKYENEDNLDILRVVLEVALEDEKISEEEISLLSRLRQKLKISERNIRILLAQLNHFPQKNNVIHDISDVNDALLNLQKKGVIFYCNHLNSGAYVIPEELVDSVKEALDIEMSREALNKLLLSLSSGQLSILLEEKGLPKYGTKQEKADRLMQAGFSPSKELDNLSVDDLYAICSSLPGVTVAGTKKEKIDRIIAHFANLVIRDVSEDASPGEKYYEYFIELAARDRENLLTNEVIKKDIDMDRAFEEGTRYLFTEKLNLELEKMNGTDHPDGCIQFSDGNTLFMWDNKSKESTYTFPNSHLRQFKRYIRDADQRVSCFMIIAPSVDEEAAYKAEKLKVESKRDTDIALISAEDLKWVAEEWDKKGEQKPFNLNVFDKTGILTRQKLERRMKLFL